MNSLGLVESIIAVHLAYFHRGINNEHDTMVVDCGARG